MKFFTEFVKLLGFGFYSMLKYFFKLLRKLLNKLNICERIYVLTSLMLGVFLLNSWQSYDIKFSEGQTFHHKIYTDDFLIMIIFLALSLIPVLIKMISEKFEDFENSLTKNTMLITRIIGLLVVSVIYMLNILFPERMSLAQQASYNWAFYGFGILLIPYWIIGLLGIKSYAQ